jgi:selenocysteine-specific elongation factor
MWVDDAFTIRGAGTVVTGIPNSGTVRPGDHLELWPAGGDVRVRRMQVYGADATEGRAGECVALNLPELHHESVRRGMVLGEAGAATLVTMAEAELRALDWFQEPLGGYVEVHLHIGTASVLAHVATLDEREIAPGRQHWVQLRWNDPLPLVPGERFVVRANLPAAKGSGLATVGGGRLLGVDNVRLRRHKPWTLAKLAARQEAMDDPLRWMELMVREQGRPMSLVELQQSCRRRPPQVAAMSEELCAEGRLQRTPSGLLVHPGVVQAAADQLLQVVEAFHGAHPQRAGLERAELTDRVGGDAQVLGLALDRLIQSRRLEREGAVYRLPGRGARLSAEDQRCCDRVARAIAGAGWAGPTEADLAVSLAIPVAQIRQAIHLLHERGALVRLGEGLFLHRDAIEAGRQVVLRLFAKGPSFTTMEFRDALGVSRKYAVPLLDHFDRVRLTVRSGNTRTPGAEAKKELT